MAVDNIRFPSETDNSFKHAFIVEGKSLIVVVIEFAGFRVVKHPFSLEILIVIEKIDLKFCIGDTGNFDLHRINLPANFNFNSGESDHFVQSVSAIIDSSKFWEQNSNFETLILQ